MRFDFLTELKLTALDVEFKAAMHKSNRELKKKAKEREHDEKIEQMAQDILKEEALRAERENSTNQL